jgi:hypothetical protein
MDAAWAAPAQSRPVERLETIERVVRFIFFSLRGSLLGRAWFRFARL